MKLMASGRRTAKWLSFRLVKKEQKQSTFFIHFLNIAINQNSFNRKNMKFVQHVSDDDDEEEEEEEEEEEDEEEETYKAERSACEDTAESEEEVTFPTTMQLNLLMTFS
jgi:hypothetical protein